MTRAKFEDILMDLPQDALDEARISVETEGLLEAVFGADVVEGLK